MRLLAAIHAKAIGAAGTFKPAKPGQLVNVSQAVVGGHADFPISSSLTSSSAMSGTIWFPSVARLAIEDRSEAFLPSHWHTLLSFGKASTALMPKLYQMAGLCRFTGPRLLLIHSGFCIGAANQAIVHRCT